MFLWQAFSENFTGLELEDGGGRGTSGINFVSYILFSDLFPPNEFLLISVCICYGGGGIITKRVVSSPRCYAGIVVV